MKYLLLVTLLLGCLSSFSQTVDSSLNYKIKRPGLIFKVQIAALSKGKPDSTDFQDIDSLSTYIMPNGLVKVLSGSFSTYEEAVLHRKQLIKKGYFGTFVLPFQHNQIVAIESLGIEVHHSLVLLINEIKMASEEHKKAVMENNRRMLELSFKSSVSKTYPDVNPENIHYRIQIGRFRKNVPLETMEKFNQLKELIYIYNAENKDLIYTVGKFDKAEQAQKLYRELEILNFQNLEIIALHNDFVIPKKFNPAN